MQHIEFKSNYSEMFMLRIEGRVIQPNSIVENTIFSFIKGV